MTSESFPAPLTPPECDCTDLDGFMLNVERLMASELVALSTHEEVAAALFLWCRAWKQVPAASLPDDNKINAAFANMSLARFMKVKNAALHGFQKCSDGRLYHRVLAKEALKAYERKLSFKNKRIADAERLRKWRKSHQGNAHEACDETGRETHFETPRETHFSNGGETHFVLEGQGQGQGHLSKKEETPRSPPSEKSAPRAPAAFAPVGATAGAAPISPAERVCEAMGVKLTEDAKRLNWPGQIAAVLANGLTIDDLIQSAKVAKERAIPNISWVIKRANGIKAEQRIAAEQQASVGQDERVSQTEWRQRLTMLFKGLPKTYDNDEDDVDIPAGTWNARWGPKPGEPGCRAPPKLIEEFQH